MKMDNIVKLEEQSSTLIKLAVTLFIFLAVYFYVSEEALRHVLIYFMILIGLYFSFRITRVIILTSAIGIILVLSSPMHGWIVPNIVLSILLL